MLLDATPTMKACTPQTLRCSNAKLYDAELRPCCRSHVVEMSSTFATLLRAADIPFWADYGTLLGAVRNPMTTWSDYPWLRQEDRPSGPVAPGIVPHDKDADWGLLREDFDRVLRVLQTPEVRRSGYDNVSRPVRGSIKVRLSRLNHTNLDLFFWDVRPDGTYFRRGYAAVDDFKGREFHHDQLFPLTTVEWEGMTLPAPRDPEAWLAFRYGDGWRSPIMANNDAVRR